MGRQKWRTMLAKNKMADPFFPKLLFLRFLGLYNFLDVAALLLELALIHEAQFDSALLVSVID
jgi:hypothetical protein